MKRKLLIAIFALTALDIILTIAGIRLGFVEESNPAMAYLVSTFPVLTGAIILAFVAAVLCLLDKVDFKWLNKVLTLVVFVKFAVFIYEVAGYTAII
jgi:hypothetical protein